MNLLNAVHERSYGKVLNSSNVDLSEWYLANLRGANEIQRIEIRVHVSPQQPHGHSCSGKWEDTHHNFSAHDRVHVDLALGIQPFRPRTPGRVSCGTCRIAEMFPIVSQLLLHSTLSDNTGFQPDIGH